MLAEKWLWHWHQFLTRCRRKSAPMLALLSASGRGGLAGNASSRLGGVAEWGGMSHLTSSGEMGRASPEEDSGLIHLVTVVKTCLGWWTKVWTLVITKRLMQHGQVLKGVQHAIDLMEMGTFYSVCSKIEGYLVLLQAHRSCFG